MMNFIILLAGELFIGSLIGFFLNDKEEGLSIQEVKFATLAFSVVNIFLLLTRPEWSTGVIVYLALSWMILILGIFLGEIIRMRIITKIARTIQKKDVQNAVDKFLYIASRYVHYNTDANKTSLENSLREVKSSLTKLKAKAKDMDNKTLSANVEAIEALLYQYADLSITLANKKDKELIELWLTVAEELSNISWDTLNHAESYIKQELSKVFGTRFVSLTFNMKK